MSAPDDLRRYAWIRAVLPPVVLAALLIFVFANWFSWLPHFPQASRSVAFRMGNSGWQPLPDSGSDIETIRVSAGGVVWSLAWRRGTGSEISRLDGATWRNYKLPGATGGFVLDGEEVWAATEAGLSRWDGSRWIAYPQPKNGSSIAAARGEAWVLGDEGHLTHFDGKNWTTEDVRLDAEDSPDLVRTAEGTLWIVRNRLWHRQGSEWLPIDGIKYANLAGTAGDGIWVVDEAGLARVTAGGVAQRFSRPEMGLRADEWPNQVSESGGGRLYAGTNRGMVEFDGASWRRMPQPPGGVSSVVSVASGSGQLLAVGVIRSRFGERLQRVLRFVPLALSLGILAAIVWLVRRYKQYQLGQHQALQQVVARGTGAMPDEFVRDERLLVKQSSWWSATVAVTVVIGAMVGYWVLRIFRPNAPAWMFLVFALGLHLLAMIWQTLVRRERKPWDPIEPGSSRFDWGPTIRALPASLAVFVLLNIGHFPAWMGDPVLWVLYGILVVTVYKLIEQQLLWRAIHRGDYDAGLAIIRRFHFYSPEGGAALLPRGHFLLLAGRYAEAERELRRAIAALRSRHAQGHALEFLGDALMEQGKEAEAQRSYEAAVAAAPKSKRAYRGMAELILRRGGDPARALPLIEKLQNAARDDRQSLKSWALAEWGRAAESEAAAEAAIRGTNQQSKPDLAATWRRVGLAMRALGREREAQDYLGKAAAIDPHGRWGMLARQALKRRASDAHQVQ